MSHDSTKVLAGSVKTSSREVTYHAGSTTTFKAGLAVRLKTGDVLSLLKSDGRWLGVSLGKGLSDNGNEVAICRDGLGVPVLLKLKQAYATVEITSYANLVDTGNDTLTVGATTFTFKTSVSTEDEVLCPASGSTNAAVAANLVAKINAHSVASLVVRAYAVGAVVTIMALTEGAAGNESIAIAYSDEGTATVGLTISDDDAGELAGGSDDYGDIDYVTIGEKAYFDDVTGKCGPLTTGMTVSDAMFVSEVKTLIQEDGTEAPCVYVDMQGGL